MSRVIFISPYLKGGKDAAKLSHRTRYIATRDGVELLRSDDDGRAPSDKQARFITRALRQFPEAKELFEYEDYRAAPSRKTASALIEQIWEQHVMALEGKENYIDYVSHRPGVKSDGDHGLWNANGKVENLSAVMREVANHPGIVWTPVVTIRRADAERLGFTDVENWRAVVNACVNEIAEGYKIDPNHLRWYAALHEKDVNYHIHMVVFSSDPKAGYLTKEGIRTVKSAFARHLFEQDLISVYKRQTEYRERGNVSESIGWLEKSAEQKNQYAQYQLGKLYLAGEQTEKDVDAALSYLKQAAEQGNQYAQYALGKLYLMGQDVPRNMELAVRYLTRSAEQGNAYAQYFLDHRNDWQSASVGSAVLRMLHHMSRIFQDNAVADSTYRGLQIDRKRRQEMRDKRIAMGHKPDDHELEDQQQTMKTIISPDGDSSQYGQNAFFYDSAEGLLTAVVLLLAEYLPPTESDPAERRHIVSVFKLVQEMLEPSPNPKAKNGFATLMDLLPATHKAKWFAGAALNSADQAMASVMSTVLSRLNAFLDSELEQVLCFDSAINAERFASEKSAIFLVLPEEDQTKNFMAGLMIQTLSRELFAVADENGGALKNRVVFFCDELGTMPAFDILPLFSAGRSRKLTLVPIIQSLAQLEKNYGKEGAEIIIDNTQDTIFGGFAPNSQTAEALSKALGSQTILSGSVSKGKESSQTLQMIERPLMTPDELKSIPKGSFVVMKTGTHPMRTRLRLFLEWGITFGEPYILPERAAREVAYADKQTLMRKIRESNSTPAPVSEQEAGEQESPETERRAPRQSAYWYGKKEAPP